MSAEGVGVGVAAVAVADLVDLVGLVAVEVLEDPAAAAATRRS